VEFSYNNQIHSSIGQSPFMINLGCHPNVRENMNSSTEDSPGMEQFLKTIKEIRSGVETVLKKTNEVMKKKWDTKKKPKVKQKSSNLV